MFTLVIAITILLPPINAVQRAHAVTQFTIYSGPHLGEDACEKAGNEMIEYIKYRLPRALVDAQPECSRTDLVDS